MTPLEIKVVYPLSARGRSVSRPVRAAVRPVSASGALRLGLLNILVAGLLYYAAWWQADPFIFRTLMMKTPLPMPGFDLSHMSSMFKSQPAELNEPPVVEATITTIYNIGGIAAAKTMGSVAYTWLTLSTGAALALALAGGASLGSRLDPSWRRKWTILVGGGALVILWLVYDTATSYGWKYPVNYSRWGAGAIVAFAVLVGLVISARSRALSRLAAVALLLSAIGSGVGIYLWGQCGALEGTYSSIPFIVGVFVVHSLYGWLLWWPLSTRWGR